MRRLLALAAVAALAGCTVDVEGAACATPGSPEGCPSGQACGTGLTCSAAAFACTPCTVGALTCLGGDVRACTAAVDPACGTFDVISTACSAGVTTCDVPQGSATPECRCERFVVDPAGATASVACRFAAVTAAIAAAGRFGIHDVLLGGVAGQTYGQDPADAAPIVIPANVILRGDDAPLDPASRVLEVTGPGLAAVQLEAGAALAGLTVRRGSGGPPLGVLVSGPSPGAGASLLEVRVTGGAPEPFARGVRVEGAGAVTLTSVAIEGVSEAGLEVTRDAVGDEVTAIDLLVDGQAAAAGPGLGVSLTSGALTLRRPVVKRHGAVGVAATGGPGVARLALEAGSIHDNFGTGLVAQVVDGLTLAGTLVCKNRGGADRNLDGTFRKVGGLFLAGTAPGLQSFSGLRVFDNDGDQVAVGLGGGTWNLAGPSAVGLACGAGMNVFAGYTSGAYGLVAAGNVDASYDAWEHFVPVLGTDALRIGPASGPPSVVIGSEETNSNYCRKPALDCPAP